MPTRRPRSSSLLRRICASLDNLCSVAVLGSNDDGFVHEFRPLAASETRRLLKQRWTPPGVRLPDQDFDAETTAAIIRITGGNFRLLDRLLTQVERIVEINELPTVTKAAVEAARESLVIGQC